MELTSTALIAAGNTIRVGQVLSNPSVSLRPSWLPVIREEQVPDRDMHVPLFDASSMHESLQQELETALLQVLHSGQFILGENVTVLESTIAAYCGSSYGVGVSSGTDALLIALMALDFSAGDLVLLPTFSFFATAGVVTRLGGRPAFVDIDPLSYNISLPSLEQTWERLSNDERKAVHSIIPVHLFGQCADMQPILQFARDREIHVIEDAAQAIGALYPASTRGQPGGSVNHPAGSMGIAGCFSFYPTKNLGAIGDGGIVVTSQSKLAERIRMLRNHGARDGYLHDVVGGNFRLDSLQAAILSVKFTKLEEWHTQRRANADRYDMLLDEHGLTDQVQIPHRLFNGPNPRTHIYNQYVVRVGDRDRLRDHLRSRGIGTAVYYPLPLHRQPCFEFLSYPEGSFPESESASKEVLALPIFPGLTEGQQEYVVEKTAEFLHQ